MSIRCDKIEYCYVKWETVDLSVYNSLNYMLFPLAQLLITEINRKFRSFDLMLQNNVYFAAVGYINWNQSYDFIYFMWIFRTVQQILVDGETCAHYIFNLNLMPNNPILVYICNVYCCWMLISLNDNFCNSFSLQSMFRQMK